MRVVLISFLVALTIASAMSDCLENADCAEHHCCAGTPSGTRVCIKYHELGEQCRFGHRTPSCGCEPGLRCKEVHAALGHCEKED